MTSPHHAEPLEFDAGQGAGTVSARLLRPSGAGFLYVMAHGAGAGMRHPFMETLAMALAECGVTTFRYQFPYMEAGGRRPDPPSALEATVRSALAAAAQAAPGLALIAGGKSLGGRMTSSTASKAPLPGVRGLVFLGFPLHAPNKPDDRRAEHLNRVTLPMLFLQGTRDTLADLTLIEVVCRRLGPRATLHLVEGGDHSFGVLKRSGRSAGDVMAELAEAIAAWVKTLAHPGPPPAVAPSPRPRA